MSRGTSENKSCACGANENANAETEKEERRRRNSRKRFGPLSARFVLPRAVSLFISFSLFLSLSRNDQKERIRNSCGNRRLESLSLSLVISSLRPKFVDPNVTRRRDKMRFDGSSLSLFPSFEILCLVLLFPETRNERRRCRGNA